jgi:2,5-diketo-D-gluconate reductase B
MPRLNIQGTQVPQLGLGTRQLTGELCEQTVVAALEMGYRHIDTARNYRNEWEIGAALRRSRVPRDVIWLTSKVWPDDLTHDALIRSVRQSLAGLQVEYIDLELIHWPSDQAPLEESLSALNELKRLGRIRHIGVSNLTHRLLARALEISPIFCVQAEYHPFRTQVELLHACREHDLLFTAYSPLAQGRVRRAPLLKEMAAELDKSPAQIALRWLVQQAQVAVIPRTHDRQHLRENLEIFDFQLDDAHMQQIHALARGQRLIDASRAPDGSG